MIHKVLFDLKIIVNMSEEAHEKKEQGKEKEHEPKEELKAPHKEVQQNKPLFNLTKQTSK